MITLFAASAALLAVAAPAQVALQAPANAAKAKDDSEKLVCKKDETIGSRLGARRVCLTAEQWKEKHREHREFAEEIQSGTRGAFSDPAVEMQGSAGAPK